ncbi:MAG TPA: tetratricopeptide repeat protein [Patescibacteria group bacterium]|nr:tetratricopeptide repeat protein [Patescibacteria group bacterium]
MWSFYLVAAALTAGVVFKLMLSLAGRGNFPHGAAPDKRDEKLSFWLGVLLPFGALLVYLPQGRPDLPGSPAIFANFEETMLRQQSLLSERPFQILVEKNPNDLGALLQLALINYRIGDFVESAKFYKRAVVEAQKIEHPLLRVYAVSLGETQVLASKGIVGEDAVGTFEYVRTLYPNSPIARYYLALAQAQHGRHAEAIQEWEDLLADGAPRAYWKAQVRDALAKSRAALKAQSPAAD